MRYVLGILGSLTFLIIGIRMIFHPEKEREITNKTYQESLKVWIDNKEKAELLTKKYVDQNLWWYRIGGAIFSLLALLGLYAVIKTYLNA